MRGSEVPVRGCACELASAGLHLGGGNSHLVMPLAPRVRGSHPISSMASVLDAQLSPTHQVEAAGRHVSKLVLAGLLLAWLLSLAQ